MVRVIGAPKRPQALFIGFSDDDPEYQAMAALVANADVLSSSYEDWHKTVRAEEWDVVVSCHPAIPLHWVPDWMHVLSFNGAATSFLARQFPNSDRLASAAEYRFTGQQPSEILHIADGIPDRLSRLINSELVPWLRELNNRPYLVPYATRGTDSVAMRSMTPQPLGKPYITDADGNLLAGMFHRANDYTITAGRATAVVLPHMPPRPSLWLAAVLELWAEADEGDRFAHLPSWRTSNEYQSPDEVAAATALATHDTDHKAAVRAYEIRRTALEADLEAARVRADQGVRRLLTGTDAELVAAVRDALERLGFEVTDMDGLVASGDARMEDLRVSDPADTTWTNITEVKGHSRGAKTSVFLDIARFAGVYALQEGAFPSSRWYVVNQFRNDPPASRPDLLPGAAADVASFATDGGLVIDTRSIFALVRAVEDGDLSADDARKSLRSSTGIYTLPSPAVP